MAEESTVEVAAEAEVAAEVEVEVPAGAAAEVTLEPAFPVHIEYGLDFGFGGVVADVDMHGYAGLFAAPVTVYLVPWFGIGFRGQLTISADEAREGPMMAGHLDDVETPSYEAWSATIGPRLRFYSGDTVHGDIAFRLAWVVDADLGWVHIDEDMGEAGPLARFTFGRQVLIVNRRGGGANLGVALSAEAGFGGAGDHRALLGSVWFHGEAGAPPARFESDYVRPDFPLTFVMDVPMFFGTNYGDVDANMIIGLGASVGVGLGDLLEPRLRLDTLHLRHPEADGTSMIGASAGLRLRLGRWAPVYLDALAGYAVAYGTEPEPIGSGMFVDLGSGLNIVHCRAGLEIGARLRLGLSEENRDLASLFLVIGGARGSRPGALGPSLSKCD